MTYVTNEKNKFSRSKQIEKDLSPPFIVDRVPSGRIEGSLAASVYSDYYNGERGGPNGLCEDDFDYTEQYYEEEKPSQMNSKKVDTYQKSLLEDKRKIGTQMKHRNQQDFEANNSNSDDDLVALLKVITFLTSIIGFRINYQFIKGCKSFVIDARKRKIL